MLEVGQILQDRYQLKQKLGQNAGRQTWLAEDLQTDFKELVVVKLLIFGGDVQWEDLKLFEREAQILKQLNFDYIPKYKDYFAIDDRSLWFGMVQNYIPGNSLKDCLHQGKRFTEEKVKQIAIEILKILEYLHQLNPPLLHRDIKPSNLILGEDDRIYLVDFGAVQDKAVAEGATFTVVGTYGYAPVEKFGGRTVPASDLYALGATLIHLLTGVSPADLPQRNMQIQFADRLNLDPSFVFWLQKLTEPALEKRYGNAKQALKVLESGKQIETESIADDYYNLANTSGQGSKSSLPIPKEILGWNWGAFLLAPYWALAHRVWFGILCFFFSSSWWFFNSSFTRDSFLKNFLMLLWFASELGIMFKLGWQGNKLAWQNLSWRKVADFKKHQRRWREFLLVFPFICGLLFINFGFFSGY
jgi:serine/threonine protein kinase